MIKLFQIDTIEHVERRYLVQIDTEKFNLEEARSIVDSGNNLSRYATEKVMNGEIHKFTEGNAEIYEVVSVQEQE